MDISRAAKRIAQYAANKIDWACKYQVQYHKGYYDKKVYRYIRRILKEENKVFEELLSMLEENIDDEECRLDHHGYCQTHYLGDPCEVDQARKLIARIKTNQ